MADKHQSKHEVVDHRRKWDKAEYEKLAQERIAREIDELRSSRRTDRAGAAVKREELKPRIETPNLEANLNKSIVINKQSNKPSNDAGFYCNVCDCVVKDSINFLDHINGKKHQRNLGMSMRIQRASVDDVKSKFASLKRQREAEQKEYSFEDKVKQAELAEEKAKAARRERKRRKKEAARGGRGGHRDDDDEDEDGEEDDAGGLRQDRAAARRGNSSTGASGDLEKLFGFKGFGVK